MKRATDSEMKVFQRITDELGEVIHAAAEEASRKIQAELGDDYFVACASASAVCLYFDDRSKGCQFVSSPAIGANAGLKSAQMLFANGLHVLRQYLNEGNNANHN